MRLNSPFSRIAKTRRALHRGEVALGRGDLAAAEMKGRASISSSGLPDRESDCLGDRGPGAARVES